MPIRITSQQQEGTQEVSDSIGGTGFGITVIDASNGSADISLFKEMIDSPDRFTGRVIYVNKLENPTNGDPWPDPFLFPNKFYFNEGGEWYESPFALGSMLDG